MNIEIIYCHPHEDSFNHGILQSVHTNLLKHGHKVKTKDLYAMGFNPVLDRNELTDRERGEVWPDVKAEQEDLLWADGLIFMYPVWWNDRPALLKGWCDRVLSKGFAYTVKDGVTTGKLEHQFALVIQTADTAQHDYRKTEAWTLLEKHMALGTLQFCGIENAIVKTLFAVSQADEDTRAHMINEAINAVGEVCNFTARSATNDSTGNVSGSPRSMKKKPKVIRTWENEGGAVPGTIN